MTLLDVKNLSVRYGSLVIVEDVSFRVEEGCWLMIVGPNGAGKSTVLNALTQGVPYEGSVRLMGRDAKSYSPNQLAQRLGMLAQGHFVGYSFTVGEVVRLGRYAYAPGLFSPKREEDERRVAEALELTGLAALERQSVLTLSGGELQRTFLAQLLAQNPSVLLLDEPTNHLDLAYQKQTFALLQGWLRGGGRAVVSVVHDLSLAKAYGTDALLLDKGRTVAGGEAAQVFTPEHLNTAYSIDVAAWMRGLLGQW